MSNTGHFKYNDGDFLGPYHIKMIKRTHKEPPRKWYADFECPKCGKIFNTAIGAVVSGGTRSCGCAYKEPKYSKRKNLLGQQFGYLTVIDSVETEPGKPTKWKCQCKCGKVTEVITSNLLKENGTRSCGCINEGKRKDITGKHFGHLTAIKRLNKQAKDNAFYWLFQCDCGQYKEAPINLVTTGRLSSCGECVTNSYSEQAVAEALRILHINYESEKTFKNCKSKNNVALRFDFYLPDYNCCIECNGEQHYIPIDYFGGEDTFKRQQENDDIKQKFCSENNIKLIVIPYTDFKYINEQYLEGLLFNE